ncbi:MAG: transposase [Methylococcaceae bacterium]
MTDYRRFYVPGATWFFTVNLALRKDNRILLEHIDLLRKSFSEVKKRQPFTIDAIVIMPDHLHCLWTLLANDLDYSTRWGQIKGYFSRHIPSDENISISRRKRRERGLWQRRFWAHLITSQEDFNAHTDYIHWNPVKHGRVNQVADWPYSSFHKFVRLGIYPVTWGHSGKFDLDAGESLE